MTSRVNHRCRLVAAVFLCATLALACSDTESEDGPADADSSNESATTNPASPSVTTTDPDGEPTADADVEQQEPETIDEFEVLWASARAEAVDSIRSGDYGTNDDSVTGPGDLVIDLSGCPAGWSEIAGADEGAITIAQTLALSGELSQFADTARGFQLYLDHVNDSGGVDGRPVELRLENDRFVAEATAELAVELVESNDVFALTTTGFPGSAEVRDFLNQSCMPQPLVVSNHPAWGDPMGNPWTTGYQLSFRTEAQLWGAWIERNLTAELPVSVAAIVGEDDLGVIYEQAFREWADAHPDVIAELTTVTHSAGAASVAAEVGELAAGEPDVVLAMTQGQACLSAMAESTTQGLDESALARFAPSVCRDPQAFMLPTGAAAGGWWVVDGGFKGTSDPAYADDPWVMWVNEQLEAAGYATSNELYSAGFAHGWAHVEALRIAAELDGGLTRTNYLLALRTMSLPNPNLVDGVVFEVDGNNDAFFVEGSQFSQWDATAGEWVEKGDVIDLNGQTGTCNWEPNAGC